MVEWSSVKWEIYEQNGKYRVEKPRILHIADKQVETSLRSHELKNGERLVATVIGISKKAVLHRLKTRKLENLND